MLLAVVALLVIGVMTMLLAVVALLVIGVVTMLLAVVALLVIGVVTMLLAVVALLVLILDDKVTANPSRWGAVGRINLANIKDSVF